MGWTFSKGHGGEGQKRQKSHHGERRVDLTQVWKEANFLEVFIHSPDK